MFDWAGTPGFRLDLTCAHRHHRLALLRAVDGDREEGWEAIGELSWHASASPPGSEPTFLGWLDDDPVWAHPHERGEVAHLEVQTRWQRLGIATWLWHRAAELVPGCPPRHSPDRTPEGDAWARAVGGPLPRWDRCSLRADVEPAAEPSVDH